MAERAPSKAALKRGRLERIEASLKRHMELYIAQLPPWVLIDDRICDAVADAYLHGTQAACDILREINAK